MTNLFNVEGQVLTPVEIYPAVSDTVNYLTFAFTFNDEWDGLTKSAIFTKGDTVHEVVLTDDAIAADEHVNLSAGVWQINIVGDIVIDAVVTRQITTDHYNFPVAQSIGTSGSVFPPSIASQVYVNVNQATPQTFVGGIPKLAADRTITHDNELTDKKFVEDKVAEITADDFNHNDLSNIQGGTAGEYYHVTSAEKTVIQNTSGTNTGDQDVSGAISTHNTAADVHSILARKTETMRLLISRTIGAGENVSAITWTQDDAGNALALIDAEIRIMVPSNSLPNGSNAYVFCRINGASADYFSSTTGSATASQVYACYIRNLVGQGYMILQKQGSYYNLHTITTGIDSLNSFSNGTVYQGTLFNSNNIAEIYLYISTLTYFPEGTTIEIYGRTA